MNGDKIIAWRHRISGVHLYEVLPYELDAVEKESLDLGQNFQFGLCSLSIFATLLVAFLLTEIPSPTRYACFFAAILVFGILGFSFLLNYYRAQKSFKSTIQTIRERQVGPLGEEGRELRPTEVAQLQVTPAETMASFAADAVLVKPEDAAPSTPPVALPDVPTQEFPPPQPGAQK